MNENVERAFKELKSKVGNLKCPVCGGDIAFFPVDTSVMVHQNQGDIPTLSASCKHCGYVMQFVLETLGVHV